jgi:pimeloyl-ACP methyl ester carboxylesterase/DNA-binding CsgD family transcriptional regulator
VGKVSSEFIERLRAAAAHGGSPLDAIIEDHAGLDEAFHDTPDALFDALNFSADRAGGSPVNLQSGSFASAVCDGDGNVLAADASFGEWLGIDRLAEVVDRISEDAPRLSAVVEDRTGRPVALAAARWSSACRWPLSDAMRQRINAEPGLFAVIGFRPSEGSWIRAGQVFRLTSRELDLARTLSISGQLRDAVNEMGIAYESGRKLLKSAMAKTGTRRQASFVRAVLAVVAGEMNSDAVSDRLFAEVFGLSLRQAGLAGQLVRGQSRDGAAGKASISSHVAKNELKVVYNVCGVSSVSELSRLYAEVQALGGLAAACDVEVGAFDKEPLRLMPRAGRPGRVAVCDHGPDDGYPVLVFHALMTGRHLPAVLVEAMQARGLRPIAFDRAGFGMSDWTPGDVAATSVADCLTIIDTLDLRRVLVLARGGIVGALTLARDHPDLVAGGVIAGPETPLPADRAREGLLGRGKRLFYDNPKFAVPVARLLSGRTNAAIMDRMVAASIAGSAPDERVYAIPRNRADHLRAVRQATTGVEGFVREIAAQAAGIEPPRLSDGRHWTVLGGKADRVYAQSEARSYWADRLPGASIRMVEDGGRWLHLSHADLIADELRTLADVAA